MNNVAEIPAAALQAGKLSTGQWLVENEVINAQQLDMCLAAQQLSRLTGNRMLIGEIIVQYGFASRSAVEDAIRHTGNLASGFTAFELPYSVCQALQVMPLGTKASTLYVAARFPLSEKDRQDVLSAAIGTGYQVTAVEEAPRNAADVLSYLNSLQGVNSGVLQNEIDQFWHMIRTGNDRSSGELLQTIIDHIFVDALQESASDVHFAYSAVDIFCKINYRLDGELFLQYMMPSECMRRLITQIKKRSVPDASERIRPQDGRMSIMHRGRNIDLRVATSSDGDGENIVVRMLDSSKTVSLDIMLAEQPEILALLKSLAKVQGKHGELIIVSGPTGQGKSTTLSGFMYEMPRERIRVDTAEDPIENSVPGVYQHQVNDLIGLTYAKVLKSALRQDPNALGVGEIRDSETAEICVSATKTGHMVFTTLHTGSVSESIARLVSMLPENSREIGMVDVAKTIRAILNQRLVRRVCKCHKQESIGSLSRKTKYASALARILDLPEDTMISTPNGCDLCRNSGHKGRVITPEAVFFPNDNALRMQMQQVILEKNGATAILQLPGVRYFSREETVKNLLLQGVIGIDSAVEALKLSALEAGV